MKIIGIIPARYGSTRFPGKPLAMIHGKSMIQRVFEQAKKANKLSEVIVASDNQRIIDHVKSFDGLVLLTSDKHRSGTERCSEALTILESELNKIDAVINIQGDEPFISPDQINNIADCFIKNKNISISTLATRITSTEELNDTGVVKIIFDKNHKAIYFSRRSIPYVKENEKNWNEDYGFYKHIGIYGYKSETLKEITLLPTSSLEKAESLEQLRWLQNGYDIHICISDIDSYSIDTPSDLQKLINKT